MNYHGTEQENSASKEDMDQDVYYRLLNGYQDVFLQKEGVARVLGEEHPIAKHMKCAAESLDREELDVAQAAYEALPEHVVDRIHHPCTGHPPPPGTRQRLLKELAPELVGDGTYHDTVGCYLQIDARKALSEQVDRHADEDGHVVDPALVYDLRRDGWPVLRVQIAEGTDKALALSLLQKACDKLERDWEDLTESGSHSGASENAEDSEEDFS